MTETTCRHETIVTVCQDCRSMVGTESHDEAWIKGRRDADEEIEEIILDKDAFIGQQSAIIQECMKVFTSTKTWNSVPDFLFEELRNYA